MAIRIPWSITESVLLLDSYFQITEGTINSKKAIKALSDDLRLLAQKNGIQIDDLYRNENGIYLQMKKMAYCATDGKDGISGGAKIFQAAVELYRKDFPQYEKILQEARDMLKYERNYEEEYYLWLSKRVSPLQLSELFSLYPIIESFYEVRELLTVPLLQTSSTITLAEVLSIVENSKEFQNKNRYKTGLAISAIKHYISYVQENAAIQSRSDLMLEDLDKHRSKYYDFRSLGGCLWIEQEKCSQDFLDKWKGYGVRFALAPKGTPITGNRPAWWTADATPTGIKVKSDAPPKKNTFRDAPKVSEAESSPEQTSSKKAVAPSRSTNTPKTSANVSPVVKSITALDSTQTYTLDFDGTESLRCTVPISFSYFEEVHTVDSWQKAYVGICKLMSEDYPNVFMHLVGKALLSGTQVDVGNESMFMRMEAAREVNDGLYIETALSETEIINRIEKLLSLCNIDKENLIIQYRLESQATGTEQTTANALVESTPEAQQLKTPAVQPVDPKHKCTPVRQSQASRNEERARVAFVEWMQQQKLTAGSIGVYRNALKRCNEYADEKGLLKQSIYLCDSADDIQSLIRTIMSDEEYRSKFSGAGLAALRKYHDYLSWLKENSQTKAQTPVQASKTLPTPKQRLHERPTAVVSPAARSVEVQQSTIPATKKIKSQSPQIEEQAISAFIEWMRLEKKLSGGSIGVYRNALNRCNEYALEHSLTSKSIYLFQSVEEVQVLVDVLAADLEFKRKVGGTGMAVLKKYLQYFTDKTKTAQPTKTISAPKKEINKRSTPLAPSTPTIDPKQKKRINQILKDRFEEGLALNAIRLDKFRMIYKGQFGEELPKDNEQLTKLLKAAGTMLDNRIYPQKSGSQNALVEEICSAVVSTLENGVSCVYISCVMERWCQALADELNIYHEAALRELILQNISTGISATKTLFLRSGSALKPESDVQRTMRESMTPLRYDQLQQRLWYLPLDVIKDVLVHSADIVQVDTETYFYADNFPASQEERNMIRRSMGRVLDDKGYLVAKDIEQIIREEFPAVAISTSGYKDYAYRNVLGWIFREYFEMSGAVISEKGNRIQMWQVFRNFCKEREWLTTEELKVFADSVGSSIYWDDVFHEMLRIGENQFIRRDKLHFDIERTDAVLEEICAGDYMPVNEVSLFLQFPPIDVSWNLFVLEGYLLNYSRKFALYQVSNSSAAVYGLLVRKSSKLENYEEVIVDLLARNRRWHTQDEALSLIVEQKCQARKRYTGFDTVIKAAYARRRELEKQGKM